MNSTVLLVITFGVSLAVSVVVAIFLIPVLRRKKAEQMIQDNGPVWHKRKQGTPTMGGLIFIAGTVVATLTVGFGEMREGRFGHITVIALALVFAAIGMFDDYVKVSKKQNLGLSAIQKFALQLLAGLGYVVIMHMLGNLETYLYIPFIGISIYIPMPIYYIFAAFVIVGTANSVNISDGVDGLLTGVTIPVTVCIIALAYFWNHTTVAIFATALLGGLVAFLIFNFHPAKVFMGDTGSHFLGVAVCALAFAMDIPLLLILLGIVYIVEALSVIIQVSYYKITKGKRILKMAPIHHHLEMCGWSEYKLFAVFTLVSAIFAAIAFFSVYQWDPPGVHR